MTAQESYERQLLGRIIADRDSYYEHADLIHPDLFEKYGEVYESFISIIKDGKEPTLSRMMSSCKGYDIIRMTKEIDYIASMEDIVSELQELYKQKRINEVCLQVAAATTSEEKTQKLTEMLVSINREQRTSLRDVYEISREYIDVMTKPVNIEIDTGFRYLNTLMGGLQRSDLIILAAETSMGKTSLALNISDNVAKGGVGVAVISLEMSERQVVQRIISSNTGLDRYKMKLTENYEVIQRSVSEYKGRPLYLVDIKNNSLSHIIGLIRGIVMKHGVSVVVLDYLQLMSDKSQRSREQEIGQMARTFKNLAKELNINIIALSQLSRPPKGFSRYPTLSRLRDSGQIEEAADVVLFIYRPEMCNVSENEDGTSTKGMAEIIIAKGRNYGTGKFECKFEASLTKFSDYDDRSRIRDYTESSRMDEPLPF